MIKKTGRYLILHNVKPAGVILGSTKPAAANPQFTRKEVDGEQAMLFLRQLTDATGYEIYELKGDPLILQTTVVCAKAEEVIAQEIGNANAVSGTSPEGMGI